MLSVMVVAGVYWWVVRQSIQADWSSLDDPAQLNLLRSFSNWTEFFGRDAFGFFRPVKNVLFLLFDRISENGLLYARLMAAGIGAAAAAAVYAFFRCLLGRREWAFAAAAIWLLSPIMVSGIVWLSAVNITVMTGSLALAFVWREKALESDRCAIASPVVLSVLFFVFALASYEGAIVFWPVLLTMDAIMYPQRFSRKRLVKNRGTILMLHLLYAAITLSYGLLYIMHAGAPDRMGFFHATSRSEAILASGTFVADHLWTWLWPFGRQAVSGGYIAGILTPVQLLAGWGVVVVLVLGAMALRKRAPAAAFGLAFFLITFAPVSNILGFRNGPYGDYYLILPSLGLALSLTIAVRFLLSGVQVRSWTRGFALGMGLLLILSRIAAVREAADWSSVWNRPAELWTRTILTFPNAYGAMVELAKMRVAAGDYETADKLAMQALRTAPGTPQAIAVLAIIADRKNDTETAFALVQKYITACPDCSWGLYFKGFLYEERMGQTDKAADYYKRAVQKRPWNADSVKAARALAYLLAGRERRPEAIDLWAESLRYDSGDYATHLNLSMAYRLEGDTERAVQHASRGYALKGN